MWCFISGMFTLRYSNIFIQLFKIINTFYFLWKEEDQFINPRNTNFMYMPHPHPSPHILVHTFDKYAMSIGNREFNCFVTNLTLKIFISAISTLSRNLWNVQASMRFLFSLRLLWLVTSSGNVYEYMAA